MGPGSLCRAVRVSIDVWECLENADKTIGEIDESDVVVVVSEQIDDPVITDDDLPHPKIVTVLTRYGLGWIRINELSELK